ncbi:CPBP family intramembrane glutamic endopeptidase [Actinomycetospora flava]|uniref:CPBP family intramembrane glutamic endopeptidase n=1 Tax=Actinomycetospora flava TaxID=3129232 RepID=A0ABU8LYM2_9PSEU
MTEVVTGVARSERARARRGLAVFVPLVVVAEVACLGLLTATGSPATLYLLLWSVALASVAARLVTREGFRDVSFRWGGPRSTSWAIVGVVVPLVVGTLSFGAVWLSGLVPFAPPGGAPGLLGALAVGLVLGVVGATGEEIGWRGYVLTRLVDAGVPRPVLVHAVLWGLWQLPLIFAGLLAVDHPDPVVAAVIFMAATVPMGFLLARMRLSSGSLWPGVVARGAWTGIVAGAFWPAAAAGGASAAVWVGAESGLLVAVALGMVAVVVCAGTWTYRRTPEDPGTSL